MQQALILFGAVLPALSAAFIWLAAWRPWRRSREANVPWGAAVGLAAAFSVTQYGLAGWPGFPPREPAQWVVFVVLLAAALEAVQSMLRPPCWARCAIRAALAGLTAWLTVPAFHAHPTLAAWTVAAAVVVLGAGLDALAVRLRGAALPLALLVAVIAAAVVLHESANAKLANLAGALAAALGMIFLFGVWRPEWPVAAGAGSVLAVAIPGLLVNGHATTDDIPAIAFVLAGLAPLGAWLAAGHELAHRAGWKRAAAATLGVSIPAGIAVAIAIQASIAERYP